MSANKRLAMVAFEMGDDVAVMNSLISQTQNNIVRKIRYIIKSCFNCTKLL